MSDLADLVSRTRFPGRVRQFAAPDPGHALALAVGCAWCESRRGGHAVAVVPPARRGEPLVQAALALAGRLGLGNLDLIPAPDPALAPEALAPCERQPVHLASLGRDLVPRWDGALPAAWLGRIAAREPLLMLPGRDPAWGHDEAALLALAWIAGDGRRVLWEVPPQADPGAWGGALDLIGRMQLPLKLLVRGLPFPPSERGLGAWWVAAAAGTEAGAVLAWALAGEECCALDLQPGGVPGWADDAAWTPGRARPIATGSGATLLCLAEDALAALAAAEAAGCSALQLTGIHPAPLPQLLAAAEAGPLLAMGEDLARHLATSEAALRVRLAPRDATGAALAVRSTPAGTGPMPPAPAPYPAAPA